MYYLGVGLADYDWHVHGQELSGEGGGTSRWLWGCSVENQHPCSEDWAMTVAGRRMSTMLKAASYAELQASFSKPTQSEITFGFETHVHNGTSVLWDGHDASFIDKPIGEWLGAVGLSQAELRSHHSAGSWLGPFDMRLTRGGAVASRYLFFLSLPVEDELADGLKDGVGDTYNVLVAVSGADPMKVAAPSSETGGANECLQRPSAPLLNTSDGDPDDHSERIKCVTLTAEIASAPEYCSNVDAYGVCPDSNNTWSDGAYTLDLACVDRAVNEGRWENDTFCSCAANYNLRFAAGRILGECSASKDECALEDSSCANRLILQTEYSQYCSLKPSDPSESWYPWIAGVVVIVIVFLVLLNRQRTQKRIRDELHLFEKDAHGVDRQLRMNAPFRRARKTEEKRVPTPGKQCWHLFLSHRWINAQDQVHSLYATLRVMVPTLHIWLDTEMPNSNTTAIVNAVTDCDVFLLFLSPGYLESFFCQKELCTAWTNNIPIIIMRDRQADKQVAVDDENWLANGIKRARFSMENAKDGTWTKEEIVKLPEAMEHVPFYKSCICISSISTPRA